MNSLSLVCIGGVCFSIMHGVLGISVHTFGRDLGLFPQYSTVLEWSRI